MPEITRFHGPAPLSVPMEQNMRCKAAKVGHRAPGGTGAPLPSASSRPRRFLCTRSLPLAFSSSLSYVPAPGTPLVSASSTPGRVRDAGERSTPSHAGLQMVPHQHPSSQAPSSRRSNRAQGSMAHPTIDTSRYNFLQAPALALGPALVPAPAPVPTCTSASLRFSPNSIWLQPRR